MTVVVDTSAVVALLLAEPQAERIGAVLTTERCVMAAPTWVELSIVVQARTGAEGGQLLDDLRIATHLEVVPFDAVAAHHALVGWRRFGKGRHPAALTLGDTYAYGLAVVLGAPLLFKGEDFAQTDVQVA